MKVSLPRRKIVGGAAGELVRAHAGLHSRQGKGRIRYIGMSTSEKHQYAPQMDAMRRYPLDFIQVDYSIANRSAANEMLPLAAERKVAVR